jgi:hypothetical protein
MSDAANDRRIGYIELCAVFSFDPSDDYCFHSSVSTTLTRDCG